MKTPLDQALDECVAANPHRLQAAKIVEWIRNRAAALPAQPAAVPAECVVVPREPTEAMLHAARDWSVKKYSQGIGHDAAIGCYRAMIAAAPPPPTSAESRGEG